MEPINQLRLQLLFGSQESAERSFLLGFMYYAGLGVPQDYGRALSHFAKAADLGSAWAEHSIGLMYEAGKGVEKNLNTAIDWYGRASARGHVPATCALGLIYKFGPDGLRDQSQALKLFEQAASAGSCMAALQLADSLERGLGSEPSESVARDWYFRAAEFSDESTAAAHAAIATLYREGRLGLGIDPIKAEEWASSSQKFLEALDVQKDL